MRHRILVVDEDVPRQAHIASCLASCNALIVSAATADEARTALSATPINLVIVDADSFERTGTELVATVRRDPRTTLVPVILLTTKGDEESRVWGTRAGANEVFCKPSDPQLLSLAARLLLTQGGLREELAQRTRELAATSREQRTFVESLVHDLKNPIAVVHVNLAWLLDRIAPEQDDLIEALADAQDGITRLQKTVDDLLMVGMLEQSRLPIRREFIEVSGLLDEVMRSHEREARARNVSLSISFDENIGVVGDPAVLRRVINNLVESSLRHTPSSGRVELSARLGTEVEIAVSNTGRPLAPEERAQLTERSIPGAPRAPSGGLGLYFCKRAVEAHDGALDIIESDEWPTSLVMRLPATG
jgi:signal transduction histidine kinase